MRTIKSLTARQVRGLHPEVGKALWDGGFWSEGYFIATVGRHASEEVIQRYVASQGRVEEYTRLHKQQQNLFDSDEG